MPPNTGKAAAHYHLDVAQTFEVVSGDANVKVGGEELNLGPGDSVEIPVGTAHEDAWNAGPDEATVLLTIEPVPRSIEMFGETSLRSRRRPTARASPPGPRAGSKGDAAARRGDCAPARLPRARLIDRPVLA